VFARLVRHHRRWLAAGFLIAIFVGTALTFLESRARDDATRLAAELAAYEPELLAIVRVVSASELALEAGAGIQGSLINPAEPCETPVRERDFQIGSWRERLGAARTRLESLARRRPERPDASYHLARALALLGDTEGVFAAVAGLESRHPDFVPARILSWLVRSRRGAEEAAPFGEAFGHRLGENETTGWQAAWVEAARHDVAGKPSESADAWSRVVKIFERRGEPFVGAAIEAYLGRGRARLTAHEFQGAAEDFAVVRSRSPDLLETDLLRAKAYFLAGARDHGSRLLEDLYAAAATESKAEVAVWVTALCCNTAEAGDFETTMRWAERVPGSFPHRVRGFLEYFRWRNVESIAASRRALEIDPTDDDARGQLIFPLLEQSLGRLGASADRALAEALAGAEDQTRRAPSQYLGWVALSEALRQSGQVSEATAAARRAIEVNARDATTHTALAIALVAAGDLEGAESAASRALERQVARYTLAALAHVREHQGRLEEARDVYERMVNQESNRATGHANLARVLNRLERHAEAVKVCERAAELQPLNNGVFEAWALARWRTGQVHGALAIADRGLKRIPDRGALHWIRAIALAELGRLEDAQRAVARGLGFEVSANEGVARVDAMIDDALRGDLSVVERRVFDHSLARACADAATRFPQGAARRLLEAASRWAPSRPPDPGEG